MICTSRQSLVLLALLLPLAHPAPAQEPPKAEVTRLLLEHCIDCHSGPRPKGGLDLTRRTLALKGGKNGPALVPGQPEKSLLWQRVHDGEMPPRKPLAEKDRDVLKRWIAASAPWSDDPIDPFRITTSKRAGLDWWALKPVARPTSSKTNNDAWIRNPIDRFILTRLEATKLTPSPEADRRTLIRRLSFDLTGLPPTPAEVETFVADKTADAYERLVDRLLESPHYGERWARHWLDVVRFGESDGFERNGIRQNAWHYRDWVIRALNADMPYDEFCRLQIAGDVLRPGELDPVKATGFLVAGIHNTVVPMNKIAEANARQDELEDLAGSVGQTFLALTVNCSRCHDHKFDPISQKDYYRFVSALSGVNHGERSVLDTVSKTDLDLLTSHLARVRKEIADLELPARNAVLAAKKAGAAKGPPPPAAIAAWDFRKDLTDRAGKLELKPVGNATQTPAGLVVDGNSYLRSSPLPVDLREKTLEAWVRLDNLKQQGGGVMTVQTPDGSVFDAIVFGEKEPRRWMAGSNGFQRTQSFNGPDDTDADREAVHFAITYHADGAITGYRNGQPYGKPYKSTGPVAFAAGKAVVAFGIRHEPAGGNHMLTGVIVQARLYDRALTAAEIAASAASGDYIGEDELVAQLSPEAKRRRNELRKELTKRSADLDALKSRSTIKLYALNSGKPPVTRLLVRGQVTEPGEAMTPGGLSALGPTANFALADSSPEADRRVKLAHWIASPDNPLFARVMVNRLWHYHFGAGIVETPNDFGFNGSRPSHPELLDWLAAEFADRKWSVKAMHRLIVTSSTYRQASAPRADGLKVDADSRLLWRKKPTRMEGEVLRDSMLEVAGLLNRDIGGRGFSDYKAVENSGTTYFYPFDPAGKESQRRSIYRFTPRSANQGLLDVFDCPDPAAAAPRRTPTTTPLQALALWNGAFALRMSEAFADRIAAAERDAHRQVALAYRLAYQREPTMQERQLAQRLATDHGLKALCRALLNSNEFLTVD